MLGIEGLMVSGPGGECPGGLSWGACAGDVRLPQLSRLRLDIFNSWCHITVLM